MDTLTDKRNRERFTQLRAEFVQDVTHVGAQCIAHNVSETLERLRSIEQTVGYKISVAVKDIVHLLPKGGEEYSYSGVMAGGVLNELDRFLYDYVMDYWNLYSPNLSTCMACYNAGLNSWHSTEPGKDAYTTRKVFASVHKFSGPEFVHLQPQYIFDRWQKMVVKRLP